MTIPRRTGRWGAACPRASAIWTLTCIAGGWTRSSRLFVETGAERPLVAHVYRQMRAAAAQQRFERAESLRRRARRLTTILDRLGGVLEATHARPRLILAPHPSGAGLEGFWLTGGRLVDFGRVNGGIEELVERTNAALAKEGRIGELGAHVPPDEVDEVRIIGAWLASHPQTPQLALRPTPGRSVLTEFLARAARPRVPSPEAGSGDERELDHDGPDLVGSDRNV